MSKERELLKRWLAGEANQIPTHILLLIETQNLLAQPEQQVKSARIFYQEGYAQAELDLKREQKPLTRQQISEGNQSMLNVTRDAFVNGVKWAEKAHGITGENDE